MARLRRAEIRITIDSLVIGDYCRHNKRIWQVVAKTIHGVGIMRLKDKHLKTVKNQTTVKPHKMEKNVVIR